ncbi:hypothetical protein F1C16_12780 [Hymenobacter sp. NBH84]|nr:hypothetical protein F1C16_12780 [Hymenobacter sp. NBH84]
MEKTRRRVERQTLASQGQTRAKVANSGRWAAPVRILLSLKFTRWQRAAKEIAARFFSYPSGPIVRGIHEAETFH